ncbi:MAG: GMC family oxidoreductase N-terminal domain-containing protein [Gemmatirosa sp.]
MPDFRLSAARRRALDALCRRIAPSAYDGDAAERADLATAVEERLAMGDPILAGQIAMLLTAFDSPLVAGLTGGPLRRFSARNADAQDATLRAWESGATGVQRTVFQAFRRLILSTYYARAEGLVGIGDRWPLHRRAPEVAWEGPLPGRTRDEEPVLRTEVTWRPPEPPTSRLPQGVIPGATLAPDTVVRAGVCVVGTGAGGAVAAARLAAAGHDVVLLEEGAWWDAADFDEREADMMPRLYADAATRATADLSVSILQGRAVGGGTAVNWLIMLPTPDWVLDEWAREHGAEGMRPHEMAPLFAQIEAETHTRCVPDDAHSPSNRALLDGARALGWRARAGMVNTRGCVRAGTCGLGCRYGARQGAQAVYLPRALAAGARLYTDVRVDRVTVSERGGEAPLKHVHATVLDRDTGAPRGSVTVVAPIVVLAGGAVGTPSILLRSGLGGPAVGRWLRLHPTTALIGRYDREMYGAAGMPMTTICDEFQRGDDGYGFWIECPPLYPAIASVVTPGFGAAHRARMRDFTHMGAMIVLVRDGADRQVSNGAVRVDRRGRPIIDYRLGDTDLRTMRRGLTATARLHLAAGAREVTALHTREHRVRSESDLPLLDALPCGPNQLTVLSAHVNGSCRLGTDARRSACTPDGQVRGTPGLYVVDGSVLPTALGVNPQETIMAVATLLAGRIAERHRPG